MTQSVSSAIWGNGNTTCRELARSKFNIYSNNNSRLFISWKINIQIIVFKNFNVRSFLKFYFRDTIDRSPSILSIDILTHSFHRFETTIVEKINLPFNNHARSLPKSKKSKYIFFPVYFLPIRTRSRGDPTTIGTKHSAKYLPPPKLDPPLFHLPPNRHQTGKFLTARKFSPKWRRNDETMTTTIWPMSMSARRLVHCDSSLSQATGRHCLGQY